MKILGFLTYNEGRLKLRHRPRPIKVVLRYLERFIGYTYMGYNIIELLNSPRWISNRRKNHHLFKKIIEGNKVVIIGSGPSAADLTAIPTNVKIMTCKGGLALLKTKNIKRTIDIYLYNGTKSNDKKVILTKSSGQSSATTIIMQKRSFIERLIYKFKINLFVTNTPKYYFKKYGFNMAEGQFVADSKYNNYYLRNIIGLKNIRALQANCRRYRNSTVIRLIQYAIYYQASDIYVVGIDFGQGGYFWGSVNYLADEHTQIDKNFIKFIAKKYSHIYSLSTRSPISKYIPVKMFEPQGAKIPKQQ